MIPVEKMRAFLDQMAVQPQPKLHELAPPQGREMMLALVQAVGPKDVPIGKITNFAIPGPGGDNLTCPSRRL